MKSRSRKRFLFPSIASNGKRVRLATDKGKAPHEIQILRVGTFWHPRYGKFSITKADLAEIKENFEKGVRGVDPAIDYAHESDKIAAAWIKSLEIKNGEEGPELWAQVEWTPRGEQVVESKEYRYLSADLAFKYQDNETLKEFGTVLLGAGLTNRPVIKNMAPTVDLSEHATIELSEYKGQDMALKSTKKITELETALAEAEAKNKALQLKLDEAEMDESDDDGDESSADDSKKGKKASDMSLEELQNAFAKLQEEHAKTCAELAEMKKNLNKEMAERKLAEKTAAFDKLMTQGKVVEAQRKPFMDGDSIKFAELAQPVKLKALGETGKAVEASEKSAAEQVLALAEEKLSTKKADNKTAAIQLVLKENSDLRAQYEKETNPYAQ